jgi:hypothetical protein
MIRLARVALAAGLLGSACLALPARVASAAECVRVVVDYGTSSGANTHCTSSSGTAADVLAKRAAELGKPPPRYKGNFLCAIDGYPESGCGDHGTEPYWSLWYWANGQWVYSSEGAAGLMVADRDGDGHPDPLGFRYHEFETKRAPRANPSYPKPPAPTTNPPRTAPPPAPAPRTGATTSAPGTPAGTQPGTQPGALPGAPSPGGATPAPGTTAAPPVAATSGPAAPDAAATAAPSGTPEAVATFAEPPLPARKGGDGLPLGTVLGAVLAAGLIGAAAYQRRGNP